MRVERGLAYSRVFALLAVLLFLAYAAVVLAEPYEKWVLAGRILGNSWSLDKAVVSPGGKFLAVVYRESGKTKIGLFTSDLAPVGTLDLSYIYGADAFFINDTHLLVAKNYNNNAGVPEASLTLYDVTKGRATLQVVLPGTQLSGIGKAFVAGRVLYVLTPKYILGIDVPTSRLSFIESPINRALQLLTVNQSVVSLTIETLCHVCLSLNEKVVSILRGTSKENYTYCHVLSLVRVGEYLGIVFDNNTIGVYRIDPKFSYVKSIRSEIVSASVSAPEYMYIYKVQAPDLKVRLTVFDPQKAAVYEVLLPLNYSKGDELRFAVLDSGFFVVANGRQFVAGNFTSGRVSQAIYSSLSSIQDLSVAPGVIVVRDYRGLEVYKLLQEPRNSTLMLEVVNEEGERVDSFTVKVNNTEYRGRGGTFNLSLPRAVYSVTVEAQGYVPSTFTVNLSSNEYRRVVLEKRKVTVRVHGESNAGQPELYLLSGAREVARGVGYLEARVVPGVYTLRVIFLNQTREWTVTITNDTEFFFFGFSQVAAPKPSEQFSNATSGGNKPLLVVVYGSDACQECRLTKQQLSRLGVNYTYKETSDRKVLEEYKELYDASVKGYQYSIPFTLVFKGQCLVAVVVGAQSDDAWRNILNLECSNTTLVVYGESRTRIPLNSTFFYAVVTKGLVAPLNHSAESQASVSQTALLALVVALAALDSVNPCTFMVFSALLLAASAFSGRRKAATTAAAFILAVYLCYFLLGLGLVRVVASLPVLRFLLVALTALMGVYMLLKSLGIQGFVAGALTPLTSIKPLRSLSERVNTIQKVLLEEARKGSIALGFAAGALVSFTLLPCSSGPYLVASVLLARLPALTGLALLAVYNLVFVLPLVAIAAAVILGGRLLLALESSTLKINLARRLLDALLGVALLLLSAWILYGSIFIYS
ncbi:cytochrome c biogenesis protein [Thermofilum pendens]|uniref:Cytochrome c biogenesis protein, transmembrane region n=1 Tax=Thermofilum pendens (strain DSM 2475 / Hrk 5) TaxID=368408 RepID=A1RYB7_THEPD|nr:cytochrome c biogenesis protein, region [Thermofilum pendens]ABL78197.1 cytochrome c biogenesis protein, transmembrane region [Thermofilum pendens Hrk 5]